MACSTCLCGTSRPTTATMRGLRLAALDRQQLRVGPVVHDRDPRSPDAEGLQLAAGGARDRDVLAAPVEPRRNPALDQPADPARQSGVDHRPLLAVHVVHQHHDRLAGNKAGEERQPVLDVDHHVRVPEVTAAQRAHALEVDRHLGAATDEADARRRPPRAGQRRGRRRRS